MQDVNGTFCGTIIAIYEFSSKEEGFIVYAVDDSEGLPRTKNLCLSHACILRRKATAYGCNQTRNQITLVNALSCGTAVSASSLSPEAGAYGIVLDFDVSVVSAG
jgi:hypothetical protein